MKERIRIRVIVPITGLSVAALDNRKETLNRFKADSTEVDFTVIREGPSSIESIYDEEYAAQETLRELVRAEQEGANAAILWCAGDPVIGAARELVSIPVVGPGEASFHVAAMLADRFTVLTTLSSLIPMTRRQVQASGLLTKLASVRALELPVLDLESVEDEAFQRAADAVQQAIREDGAEAIVLGCMGMINLSEKLAAHFRDKGVSIPIVNPGISSLKVAEMLATMRLSHSKITYPMPRKTEEMKKIST